MEGREKSKFDLEERTSKYAESIIDFCKKIKLDTITRPIISQLVRSGTSIGANYCEADEASSMKDFVNKICIAKKETKETKGTLRGLKSKSLFQKRSTTSDIIYSLGYCAQEP